MQTSRSVRYWLCAAAAIEAALFLWLCSLGQEAFAAFVWTPDTPGYVRLGLSLSDFKLIAGPRTLGYPIFLAGGYFLAGPVYGMYVTIALQLALNLVFTWMCWRLLAQLVPDTPEHIRFIATGLFFWASLGMALYLMTDFLAALCFAVFLYGVLFWRTTPGVVLASFSLGCATMLRPTFTLVPILLPIMVYLAGRVTVRVLRWQLVVFVATSCLATGLSISYQYAFNGYLGPSPILVNTLREMIYYGLPESQVRQPDYAEFVRDFEAEIAALAGQPYATLSASARDDFAKDVFRRRTRGRMPAIALNVAKNFVKYLFAPIESTVMRVVRVLWSDHVYTTYVRPLLTLVCAPIWVMALIPPIRSSRKHRTYYLLVMLLLVYIVGLTATSTGAGERIRFTVLVLMLPVAAWNIASLMGRVRLSSTPILNVGVTRLG